MKRTLLLLLALSPFLLNAQSPVKTKKYPSLLWEITGNGLSRPSYLFGTMHVSSKIAFHLADSFYLGIRQADVVALETNPESWQEDMSKYDVEDNNNYSYLRRSFGNYMPPPEDYLNINTLKFGAYDKKVERMLYSNPSTINNLLYRTYGNGMSDFEEDTYLDLYIYQCGKRWGKKVAGVEQYGESMKLMIEAYSDAAKDKNKKQRSYDYDSDFSNAKLQEAYRNGNLDWLDSINRYNSYSSAFDEKFLYKRNEIQANSIDSILRTGLSLFVGVGAAHLPGERGVIEMLRSKGYRLRPVKMGERDSNHKNQVEKMRVPVKFNAQAADDGLFKVDIPGKFYKFGDDPLLKQLQYADMANGSYYMVTRIMTNAWLWGHSSDRVYKVIDSLLYENIPGKILSKTPITRNGNKGVDITNKTRRGDIQRYNIFVTPFEVIVFKMSGTGDYVKEGEEAKKFFGSIQLKEYTGNTAKDAWKKYSPSYGGFSVSLPHEPFADEYDGSRVFDAEDRITQTHYRVMRTDIHNYQFAEEDTFDLGLMEESFASSEFIDQLLSRQQTNHGGYPALYCSYKGKNGDIYLTRFIIQGPHYYTLVARGARETETMRNFLNSFEIKPYTYGEIKTHTDTSLYFTVKTPVYPDNSKEKLDIPQFNYYAGALEELTEDELLATGTFRSTLIANDTTGEKVFVSFFKASRYSYLKDSSELEKENQYSLFGDTSWIIKYKKKYELPDKMKVWESMITDTGSSRLLWSKTFYKDGIGFLLIAQSDTLTPPSTFLRSFFDSFTPADTLKGTDMFVKKTNLFFEDFMSSDSIAHKRAIKSMYHIKLDSADLPQLKNAISFLNWSEKKYLDTKQSLIGKLDDIPTKAASDYLLELYYAAGDTLDLQYAALSALLGQKTQYAYNLFRNIIISEPPVLNISLNNNTAYNYNSNWSPAARRGRSVAAYNDYNTYSYGGFIYNLYDSLKLTRTILPDLLPLLNLDDYKYNLMQLIGQMVDSNLVKAKDYEMYFGKFLLESRQELRKQSIAEKQIAIRKAEKSKEDKEQSPLTFEYEDDNDEETDLGNEDLSLYATLLLPFRDSKPGVQQVINQMLASSDKRLKYNTTMLLIRNNQPYPDTLLNYFAGMEDYRYELYTYLREIKKEKLFPAKYNNHLDLAKSKLLGLNSYNKPDSLVFIDSLPAELRGKKGYVYFFRYKSKKDDTNWKLATVGLTPREPSVFEFTEKEDAEEASDYEYAPAYTFRNSRYNLTSFTDTKIEEDDETPLDKQLKKELKKMLYSKRKSAKEFYDDRMDYASDMLLNY